LKNFEALTVIMQPKNRSGNFTLVQQVAGEI